MLSPTTIEPQPGFGDALVAGYGRYGDGRGEGRHNSEENGTGDSLGNEGGNGWGDSHNGMHGDGWGSPWEDFGTPTDVAGLLYDPAVWAVLHALLSRAAALVFVYCRAFWRDGVDLIVPYSNGSIRRVSFFL